MSTHQGGGITAHTVRADTIHLHAPATATHDGCAPDWSIQELFYYLRPDISPGGSTELWDEVGNDVLDKLSTGQLQAWGREILRSPTKSFLNLAPIDRSYWKTARFTFAFLLDGHDRDLHATQRTPSGLPDYADLRVSRRNAVQLWTHPILGRWTVSAATLTARYFNAPPDRMSIDCNTITLYDAQIETRYDASGAPQYKEVIAPAYILAAGVNSAIVRSLAWRPQQIAFVDNATNTEKEYFLSGAVDASAQNGTVKFFLDPQAALAPQPITPETLQRATVFFDERINSVHSGIDAPAVLRRGPKLVLQVLPTFAFDKNRTIDHAAPQSLAPYFMPDGYQMYDGRPRHDGWIWHQPPQPIPPMPNPVVWWHSRLNWDGYVEIVLILEESDGPLDLLRGYPLERQIVKTLDSVSDGFAKLSIRSPVIIRIGLLGVLGTRLAKSHPAYTKGFDQPDLLTQPLSLTDMTKPIGRQLRPTLDTLWRAAGWADGSPSYGRGAWDGYDNPFPYQ